MDVSIEPLGPGAPLDPALLARLHAELLPQSPVALMGIRFMTDFYYRVLPAAGLLTGAVAFADDEPAGFIAETDDPDGFMTRAVRRWPWRLTRVVALSIATDPRRLPALLEARRIMAGREPRRGAPHEGEILSLGVRPRFRTLKIDGTGRRVSEALLAGSLERLRGRGIESVRAVVDRSNLATQLFYRSQGWVLEPTARPGWRAATVDFVVRTDERA